MRINAVKQALASGQVQLGALASSPTRASIGAFIDTEHGGLRLVTTIFFSEGPDPVFDCVPPLARA